MKMSTEEVGNTALAQKHPCHTTERSKRLVENVLGKKYAGARLAKAGSITWKFWGRENCILAGRCARRCGDKCSPFRNCPGRPGEETGNVRTVKGDAPWRRLSNTPMNTSCLGKMCPRKMCDILICCQLSGLRSRLAEAAITSMPQSPSAVVGFKNHPASIPAAMAQFATPGFFHASNPDEACTADP